MRTVIGIDYGTQSARALLVDAETGQALCSHSIRYPHGVMAGDLASAEDYETALLELLAQAQNMDEILQIEARLTQVRAELEAVTSTLRLYDNQVTYATVYLNISEVTEYTVTQEPETVWEEIGAGFSQTMSDIGEGLKDFFVFVVVNSPYLLVLAAAAVGLILLYKRRKRKNAPPQDHKPE